ncbi:MAG: hypothetical protein R3E08_02940 [Thiotrichaceae bacterium]
MAQDEARAVADYIAGMTDRFAIVEYERLFDPSSLLLVVIQCVFEVKTFA